MLNALTQSHLNKNYKDASVSAIKLITDDLNSESWGSPSTKKIKADHAAAMLKYLCELQIWHLLARCLIHQSLLHSGF